MWVQSRGERRLLAQSPPLSFVTAEERAYNPGTGILLPTREIRL